MRASKGHHEMYQCGASICNTDTARDAVCFEWHDCDWRRVPVFARPIKRGREQLLAPRLFPLAKRSTCVGSKPRRIGVSYISVRHFLLMLSNIEAKGQWYLFILSGTLVCRAALMWLVNSCKVTTVSCRAVAGLCKAFRDWNQAGARAFLQKLMNRKRVPC